jgi:hypothetical protein
MRKKTEKAKRGGRRKTKDIEAPVEGSSPATPATPAPDAPPTGSKKLKDMTPEEKKTYRAWRRQKRKEKAAGGAARAASNVTAATPPASGNGNGAHAPALGFAGFRLVGEFTPLGALGWRVEQRGPVGSGPEWVSHDGTFTSPVDAVQYIARKVVVFDAVPAAVATS